MITKFLNSLEDPNRPLLAPNYWLLTKLGLLLPDTKLQKYAYIFLHQLVVFFVITQWMELYVTRSDLDLVLTNLKVSMVSTVCVVKTNTFVIWQNEWRELLDYVTEADKEEREHRDTIKGKILDRYTKYCRRLTYFYWVLITTTFVTALCIPLLKYSSGAKYREELRNGTELFPHFMISWMPFDKNQAPGCWITYLWYIYMGTCGAAVIAAYDTSAIVIMVLFRGKLELLRERSRQMLGTDGKGVSDEEAWKMVAQLHRVHVLLIKYSKLFNTLLSPVMFLYVVICSIMFCASAYQLTTATTTTQKLQMSEYLVFGVTQLFMFCWHSNDVLVKAEALPLGPYESEWWTANVRQRKSILILAGQFRINHIFTAGPFTNLTLATFVTILKGSYSYYTLLRPRE